MLRWTERVMNGEAGTLVHNEACNLDGCLIGEAAAVLGLDHPEACERIDAILGIARNWYGGASTASPCCAFPRALARGDTAAALAICLAVEDALLRIKRDDDLTR